MLFLLLLFFFLPLILVLWVWKEWSCSIIGSEQRLTHKYVTTSENSWTKTNNWACELITTRLSTFQSLTVATLSTDHLVFYCFGKSASFVAFQQDVKNWYVIITFTSISLFSVVFAFFVLVFVYRRNSPSTKQQQQSSRKWSAKNQIRNEMRNVTNICNWMKKMRNVNNFTFTFRWSWIFAHSHHKIDEPTFSCSSLSIL